MAVAATAGAALRRRVQSHPGPGTHWLYTTVDSRRPSPAVVAQRSEHSIKMHTDVSWYRVSVIREPSIIGSSGVQLWSCRRVQDAPWPSRRHPTPRCGRWRRRRLTISLELPLGPHAARGSHAACMRHRWVMSGRRLRVFSPPSATPAQAAGQVAALKCRPAAGLPSPCHVSFIKAVEGRASFLALRCGPEEHPPQVGMPGRQLQAAIRNRARSAPQPSHSLSNCSYTRCNSSSLTADHRQDHNERR